MKSQIKFYTTLELDLDDLEVLLEHARFYRKHASGGGSSRRTAEVTDALREAQASLVNVSKAVDDSSHTVAIVPPSSLPPGLGGSELPSLPEAPEEQP